MQDRLDGVCMNLGMDNVKRMTPLRYSGPLGILAMCADLLINLPGRFVAARGPIDISRAHRIATWGGTGYTPSGVTDDPVETWQQALDATGPDDLTINTSVTSPVESAAIIERQLSCLPAYAERVAAVRGPALTHSGPLTWPLARQLFIDTIYR